ncbi:hypothetical protein PUR35_26805 [Streptomyces sp. JV184]|nr:hypothetical protein [Streptomyces sp. JV184]
MAAAGAGTIGLTESGGDPTAWDALVRTLKEHRTRD